MILLVLLWWILLVRGTRATALQLLVNNMLLGLDNAGLLWLDNAGLLHRLLHLNGRGLHLLHLLLLHHLLLRKSLHLLQRMLLHHRRRRITALLLHDHLSRARYLLLSRYDHPLLLHLLALPAHLRGRPTCRRLRRPRQRRQNGRFRNRFQPLRVLPRRRQSPRRRKTARQRKVDALVFWGCLRFRDQRTQLVLVLRGPQKRILQKLLRRGTDGGVALDAGTDQIPQLRVLDLADHFRLLAPHHLVVHLHGRHTLRERERAGNQLDQAHTWRRGKNSYSSLSSECDRVLGIQKNDGLERDLCPEKEAKSKMRSW